MTFREMINKYQEGTLEEQQTELVKNEIEKHEAISDYLYEASQISDLDTLESVTAEEQNGKKADDFTKMVRKAIRLAFVKMGLVVGCTILTVILAVIYLLPDFVSGFYYNPNEVVGTSSTGYDINRMSLDLAVYSELFLPSKYRDHVIAEDLGYGKYSLMIPQTSSYSGQFTTVGGVLDRNKLTLYDPNLLTGFPGNAFVMPSPVSGIYPATGAVGSAERAFAKLQELDDDAVYTAYFSLNELTDYETIYEQVGMAWYAVDCGTTYNFGFWSNFSGNVFDWDREKYPLLSTKDSNGSIKESLENAASEDAMRTHLLSMLRYMQDHPEVMELFGCDHYALDFVIRHIETNGMKIYGFVAIGDQETILKIAEADNIAYVFTELYQ